MSKMVKSGNHRPPAKQRPHLNNNNNENSTNVSTSGHVSPMHSERMRGAGAGNGGSHLKNVNKYEPTPGGASPRLQHGASTLDEMNHGSPVPSRRHELSQPPSHAHPHYSSSGAVASHSPKMGGKNLNSNGGGHHHHHHHL